MGKRGVRVIIVPRWLSIAMLIVVMAAMAGMIYFLSGRAYAGAVHPLPRLMLRVLQRSGPAPSRTALLAALMPAAANALVFVPFGFLTFMLLDRNGRSRSRTYVLTCLAALVFALLLSLWQVILPTRVTAVFDTMSNAAGACIGAAFAHLRKQVRVGFDL